MSAAVRHGITRADDALPVISRVVEHGGVVFDAHNALVEIMVTAAK